MPTDKLVGWAAWEDIYIGAVNCSEVHEGDRAVGLPCRICGKPIEVGQAVAHCYPDKQTPPFEHLMCQRKESRDANQD